MTQSTNLACANAIAEQIGARAFLMLGTRYKTGDANSLTFDVRGSQSANRIKIILEPTDTYTMQFWKCRGLSARMVKEHSGVYAYMLHDLIESETGLRTSL